MSTDEEQKLLAEIARLDAECSVLRMKVRVQEDAITLVRQLFCTLGDSTTWDALAAAEKPRRESPRPRQLRFRAVLNGVLRDPPCLCEALDGMVAAEGHPFWQKHRPPLHEGCRCYLEDVTDRRG